MPVAECWNGIGFNYNGWVRRALVKAVRRDVYDNRDRMSRKMFARWAGLGSTVLVTAAHVCLFQ